MYISRHHCSSTSQHTHRRNPSCCPHTPEIVLVHDATPNLDPEPCGAHMVVVRARPPRRIRAPTTFVRCASTRCRSAVRAMGCQMRAPRASGVVPRRRCRMVELAVEADEMFEARSIGGCWTETPTWAASLFQMSDRLDLHLPLIIWGRGCHRTHGRLPARMSRTTGSKTNETRGQR